MKNRYELATCTHSPESQLYCGLYQSKHGHHAEGRDCPPLLHLHETQPGALHTGLGSPVQEGHRPGRADPEESLKNDQRGGTALLWRQARGFGVVQPGKEKTSGRPYCSFSIYKGRTFI